MEANDSRGGGLWMHSALPCVPASTRCSNSSCTVCPSARGTPPPAWAFAYLRRGRGGGTRGRGLGRGEDERGGGPDPLGRRKGGQVACASPSRHGGKQAISPPGGCIRGEEGGGVCRGLRKNRPHIFAWGGGFQGGGGGGLGGDPPPRGHPELAPKKFFDLN